MAWAAIPAPGDGLGDIIMLIIPITIVIIIIIIIIISSSWRGRWARVLHVGSNPGEANGPGFSLLVSQGRLRACADLRVPSAELRVQSTLVPLLVVIYHC